MSAQSRLAAGMKPRPAAQVVIDSLVKAETFCDFLVSRVFQDRTAAADQDRQFATIHAEASE